MHATALGGGLSQLIGACVRWLRDLYATPGGATVAEVGFVLAGAVLARTRCPPPATCGRPGRQALRHAHTARLAGHLEPDLGAVVLEHPEPAAYCVAGRYPTVIVTTGAVDALDSGQLDAVVATNAPTCRHHALKAAARIERQVLPFLLGPADPIGRLRRHLLRVTAAALALAPVLMALTPAVVALALGRVPAA